LRLETRDVRPVQCLRIEITPGRFNLPAPQAYVQAVRNVLDTQATTEFLQRNGIRHCTPQRDAPDLASHTLFLRPERAVKQGSNELITFHMTLRDNLLGSVPWEGQVTTMLGLHPTTLGQCADVGRVGELLRDALIALRESGFVTFPGQKPWMPKRLFQTVTCDA
jgi:hypothetical protein